MGRDTPSVKPARRRADAERNVARIIHAAVDALAVNPNVSMGDIARHAGVARTTLYAHFPTREDLIDTATQHAIAEITTVIEATEPERGDPADALARIVAVVWRTLGRYHALIAINAGRLAPEELQARHAPLRTALEPLITRGQREGTFRADVPAGWHLAMIVATMHAASHQLQHQRLPEPDVESALLATVLGALMPAPAKRSHRVARPPHDAR